MRTRNQTDRRRSVDRKIRHTAVHNTEQRRRTISRIHLPTKSQIYVTADHGRTYHDADNHLVIIVSVKKITHHHHFKVTDSVAKCCTLPVDATQQRFGFYSFYVRVSRHGRRFKSRLHRRRTQVHSARSSLVVTHDQSTN